MRAWMSARRLRAWATMRDDECRAGASKSDDERKALASVSDEWTTMSARLVQAWERWSMPKGSFLEGPLEHLSLFFCKPYAFSVILNWSLYYPFGDGLWRVIVSPTCMHLKLVRYEYSTGLVMTTQMRWRRRKIFGEENFSSSLFKDFEHSIQT